MGITDRMWDALTTVIKMNDKVVSLAHAVKEQQDKIEILSERVIKLETILDILVQVSKNKPALLSAALEEKVS